MCPSEEVVRSEVRVVLHREGVKEISSNSARIATTSAKTGEEELVRLT